MSKIHFSDIRQVEMLNDKYNVILLVTKERGAFYFQKINGIFLRTFLSFILLYMKKVLLRPDFYNILRHFALSLKEWQKLIRNLKIYIKLFVLN